MKTFALVHLDCECRHGGSQGHVPVWPPKTEEEERLLLVSTVPKNTQHNTKWAVKVFEEWQSSRRDKAPRQLASSLTALDLTNIPDLIRNAESLNLWLSRFVKEREVIK